MTEDKWWTCIGIIIVVWSGVWAYAGYQWGYGASKFDHIPIIKYKCFEGIVYRSTSGYWEDTKQHCKTLEEVK